MTTRRWRRVERGEVTKLATALQKNGVLYNGMTFDALCRKYGTANVKHAPGRGWYKLT